MGNNLWKVSLFLLLALLQSILALSPMNRGDLNQYQKRDITPDWEDLGWAWGKRSGVGSQIPRRYLRALHPVKKNPDWHDLGWTWGRK